MYVSGAETPASKSKEVTPVQEPAAPAVEESRQKAGMLSDAGKSAAARGKTEPKVTKQEPETTAGKPTAAAPASQVSFYHWFESSC